MKSKKNNNIEISEKEVEKEQLVEVEPKQEHCLLYTSPSPRD